jgi:hypothetical protein
MRDIVLAEDGDEVSVVTTAISLRQAIIQVEIENKGFDFAEIFSLTPERARHLAQILLIAADVVERFTEDDGVPWSRCHFPSSPGQPA